MIRVFYLFPILVFMCVTGILYRENKPEKRIEKRPNTKNEKVKSNLPAEVERIAIIIDF